MNENDNVLENNEVQEQETVKEQEAVKEQEIEEAAAEEAVEIHEEVAEIEAAVEIEETVEIEGEVEEIEEAEIEAAEIEEAIDEETGEIEEAELVAIAVEEIDEEIEEIEEVYEEREVSVAGNSEAPVEVAAFDISTADLLMETEVKSGALYYDEEPDPDEAKEGLFSRIFGFFSRLPLVGRIIKDTRADTAFETYSKFKRFFEAMDSSDPLYPSVRQTSGLCDDALRIAKQRIQLGTRLQEYDEKLLELECFSRLNEDELARLKQLLEYFMSLTVERNTLYNKLSDFDKSLVDMFKLEEEAALAVPQIRDAEERQRLLKQDLGYLYGEKADLVYERANMEKGLQFIHYFTLGLVGLFIAMTLLLGFLNIFNGTNIFLPTVVITMMVIVIASLLYIFRRRIRYELRLNFKKQLRAVELLNKKNVVYAYYTNFLRFVYNKYKVRNAQMLENNLQDFSSYKFLVGRIDNLRRTMYETEAEIERFMKEKRLTGLRASIEGFAKTANLDDKKRYYEELIKSKETLERELNALDLRHEEIWDTLMVLNETDRSTGKIIDKIIQTYLDEAGGLLTSIDPA